MKNDVITHHQNLLKIDNKEKELMLDTLVNFFKQVFLHGVTREKIITPKYF